ncbi:hypothetical protein [Candidatus Nitrosotenuis uzonensis]|uniref:Uncharacterized protein n=1 Tax=Candidatus Nitrosotenuis uzonensis TaxID=1407055 RepID=A0A812EYU0_9ARCH|nr:hypothetical protein [Candidatus Nitrosotenuis uzonensis]CAE6489162.1 conserved membrane hypothetical protein [Candidatus Nitrosotenuis uzonensis]
MSHIDVDVVDFLLLTIYPVAALFIIEIISRAAKITNWIKLLTQGIVSIGFAIAYVTLITAHWLTALVLLALAIALFYQARLAKIKPGKSVY